MMTIVCLLADLLAFAQLACSRFYFAAVVACIHVCVRVRVCKSRCCYCYFIAAFAGLIISFNGHNY